MTDWSEYAEDSVEANIPRDRFGRPYIKTADGNKPYTRVTTFAGTLEDMYGLGQWQQRMVAIGLAKRKDLLMSVSAHATDSAEDKKILNALCDDAKEAAGASASANLGTALHRLCERLDCGQLSIADAPEAAQADLRAYQQATAKLEMLGIERFVVLDDLQVAGTFDRIVRYEGETYVADIKTGSLEYGATKMATQLALYSRGRLYSPADGERTPIEVSQTAGLIIHLPAGTGRCEILWLNIGAGWESVEHSTWVRGWRKRRDLLAKTGMSSEVKPEPGEPYCSDCDQDTHRCKGCGKPLAHGEGACATCSAEALLTDQLGATRIPAAEQIAQALTVEALEAAYFEYADEWTDELTALAAARKAVLTADPADLKAAVEPLRDPPKHKDEIAAKIPRLRSVEAINQLWEANQLTWTAEHTRLAKARRAALEAKAGAA